MTTDNIVLEDIEEKKEVQKKIIELPQTVNGEKASEEEFLNILRLVAPGTNLRTALEGIVKIGKGALIVVENEMTGEIIDGGFKLNCRFTPQKLMELSKMDGAMILSKDMKKIMYCNVLLTPDNKIPTNETGTRHKAAERSAKMTGTLVIAVSERKNEIHLYYKNVKYHLKDTSEISRKTFTTLQLLEKQRELFDKAITSLNEAELKNDLDLKHACKAIQKGELMQRILMSIERNIIELGTEAQSVKSRIKEIMSEVERETNLVIKDYTKLNTRKSKNLLESLSYDEIIDMENILTSLAQKETNLLEAVKGWRMLSKTGLSEQELSVLIRELHSLEQIIKVDQAKYIELLGQEKGEQLARGVRRLANH